MIVRKIVMALVAAGATVAAACVMVVAAAFALYAWAEPALGRAGAAAAVCLACAVLIALVGLIAGMIAAGVKKKAAEAPSLVEQVINLAKEKPLVSGGALIGAAALAMRNPSALMMVLKAALSRRKPAR